MSIICSTDTLPAHTIRFKGWSLRGGFPNNYESLDERISLKTSAYFMIASIKKINASHNWPKKDIVLIRLHIQRSVSDNYIGPCICGMLTLIDKLMW